MAEASMQQPSTAIVLLAGGQARRFARKLEHPIDGRPMILHCYRNLRATGWPIYIAGQGSFPREVDAMLEAPLLIDRRPNGGPQRAFLSACGAIRAERVFAVAADQPRLDASVLRRLASSWKTGDEAAVPEHDGRIEPLAALYARRAALREGFELRAIGKNAMHELIERLQTRFVRMDAKYFHNVNSPSDVIGTASAQ